MWSRLLHQLADKTLVRVETYWSFRRTPQLVAHIVGTLTAIVQATSLKWSQASAPNEKAILDEPHTAKRLLLGLIPTENDLCGLQVKVGYDYLIVLHKEML